MTQLAATSADTPSQQPLPTGARILVGIGIFLSATFWLLVFGQLTFLAPLTEKLILDCKMRIPWFTERVMFDSWWIVPLIAVAALAGCVAIRKKWAWSFTLLVLPLMINVVVCLGLFVPTLELLRELSGRVAGAE